MNEPQIMSKELKKQFLKEEQLPKPEEQLLQKNLLDDSNIQTVLGKIKKAYIRSIIGEQNLPFFIEYIKEVITFINHDKNTEELQIYGKITGTNANYCNCKIVVQISPYVERKTYESIDQVDMSFDELLANCSTISFHHFRNFTTNYYKGLFDTKEKAEMFIYYMKVFARDILNYSNIFFSISEESDSGLRYYCEKNCKNIFEVNNRRNGHKITYYCEIL